MTADSTKLPTEEAEQRPPGQRRRLSYDDIRDTLPPVPRRFENINSIKDFRQRFPDHCSRPDEVDLYGLVCNHVDFADVQLSVFQEFKVQGAVFWGCHFPPTMDHMWPSMEGAVRLDNPDHLPFLPYRHAMYRTEELMRDDKDIYKWYKEHDHDVMSRMFMTMHDFEMTEALQSYTAGKVIVGIMGGHAMKRSSPEYESIVRLCRELARRGFIIATGGGPGAMEAGNLGAYLSSPDFDDSVMDKALAIMRTNNPEVKEYMHYQCQEEVIKLFGYPVCQPSLGVPTWLYGHEPANRFCTWSAKYFSNSIREDILLEVCNGGLIFTPGAGGTRQELWQSATASSYADEVTSFSIPFIFYTDFWKKNGLFNAFLSIAKAEDEARDRQRGFSDRIVLHSMDEQQDIVAFLEQYVHERGLALSTQQDLECHARDCTRTKRNFASLSGPIRAVLKVSSMLQDLRERSLQGMINQG